MSFTVPPPLAVTTRSTPSFVSFTSVAAPSTLFGQCDMFPALADPEPSGFAEAVVATVALVVAVGAADGCVVVGFVSSQPSAERPNASAMIQNRETTGSSFVATGDGQTRRPMITPVGRGCQAYPAWMMVP